MNKLDPSIDKQIDLNLNIGEYYGQGREVLEQELMQYATSVNIASGAHTGDPAQIDKAIKACKNHTNIAMGALVSYPDLIGYGLRKIEMSREELRISIIAQLGATAAVAKANGYELQHVRAHGYLYEQMIYNYSVAETVARAIQDFSKWLILVGPNGPVLEEVGSWTNIRTAYEARIDRRYKEAALQLEYDQEKDARIDLDTLTDRARRLVVQSKVKTESEIEEDISYESIHLPSNLVNIGDVAKLIKGMVANPMPLKSIDYEPYLSEFI